MTFDLCLMMYSRRVTDVLLILVLAVIPTIEHYHYVTEHTSILASLCQLATQLDVFSDDLSLPVTSVTHYTHHTYTQGTCTEVKRRLVANPEEDTLQSLTYNKYGV